MGKAMIIGCGGVAGVAIHSAARTAMILRKS
jgi:saccharopine dehydrogenase-like NADP-dependent oxidoreductase